LNQLADTFDEDVSRRRSNPERGRLAIIHEMEQILCSEYNTDQRGRFTVKSVFKLYLDLCRELDIAPGLYYTGHTVISDERVQALAEESGKSFDEVINELGVDA